MDCLIEAGANIRAPAASDGGITLLEAAAGIFQQDYEFKFNRAWHAHDLARFNQKSAQRISIFKKLLAHDAEINRTDGTDSSVLHRLIQGSQIECLKLALKEEANIEDRNPIDGSTPLQCAAKSGDKEAIQLLLHFGAEINASAADNHAHGRTALQAAMHNDFQGKGKPVHVIEELVWLLLHNGAEVNAPAGKCYGRTALQAATSYAEPSARVVVLLLKQGAQVNANPAEVGGVTALQGAAISGDLQIAKILIAEGANVNAGAAPTEGRTAIEGAAEHGRLEMVQLLLHAGVKAELNGWFSTAIDFATKSERFDIADLLRKHSQEALNTFAHQLEQQLPNPGMILGEDDGDQLMS
ncbi:hypothetical protein G7Z17_g7742 [Cylindrodendrum hubeiense]|uniref:Ankyrin repeat protein n=1 Tax=Cylindrodendrum hubeiense TaxID=595255 RepID=A0A9P5HAW4_9HYPO|nr:hypothetical protein G7Z17_g7742 [Cylindrodendrum hubeiense]